MELLRRFYKIFACPDDKGKLSYERRSLHCSKCGRVFPVFSANLVELLPSKPYPLRLNNAIEESYWSTYILSLGKRFRSNPSGIGWGYLPALSPGLRTFVKKEREVARRYLDAHIQGLICDVSGGAGSYSLKFAKEAKLVLHCDLDVDAVNCALNQAEKRKLKNILFVRADYLQLPFASNVFDAMICIDTLERGLSHELRLLTEILRCLKSSGRFVADFHNRRLVRNNRIIECDKETFRKILLQVGLINYSLGPIGYVPAEIILFEKTYDILDRIFKLFFSPSRYMVLGEKEAGNH